MFQNFSFSILPHLIWCHTHSESVISILSNALRVFELDHREEAQQLVRPGYYWQAWEQSGWPNQLQVYLYFLSFSNLVTLFIDIATLIKHSDKTRSIFKALDNILIIGLVIFRNWWASVHWTSGLKTLTLKSLSLSYTIPWVYKVDHDNFKQYYYLFMIMN